MTERSATPWSRDERLALAGVVVAGVLIRLVLLPTDGLRGDIDQFVGWVHALAVSGLGTLYSGTPVGPVAFGRSWPTCGPSWPPSNRLRHRHRLRRPGHPGAHEGAGHARGPRAGGHRRLGTARSSALGRLGAAAILLHPAVIYVSAWWGQYESIFLLSGLGAVVAAINGRNGLAAVLVAAALMTKPQAVAFVLPFTAWFWATGLASAGVRGGVIGLVRAGLIGLATLVVLWLPFLPAAGPVRTSKASACTRPTCSGSCH